MEATVSHFVNIGNILNDISNPDFETDISLNTSLTGSGPCGATVARLTPDQKVACSNHVGVNVAFLSYPLEVNHHLCCDKLYPLPSPPPTGTHEKALWGS